MPLPGFRPWCRRVGRFLILSLFFQIQSTPACCAGTTPVTSAILKGPGFQDLDGDGCPDDQEGLYGLNPLLPDTDGDGVLDGDEDPDGDALINRREFQESTDLLLADTDEDGWNDEQEVTAGSSPTDPDSTPSLQIAAPQAASLFLPGRRGIIPSAVHQAPPPLSVFLPGNDGTLPAGIVQGRPPLTIEKEAGPETIRLLVSPSGRANGHFGYSLAVAPDTDGDGAADLAVGEPSLKSEGGSGLGAAYLFSATGDLLHSFSSPNEDGGEFGFDVAGIPDVNGDGRGDLLFGALDEDIGAMSGAGRAYLFEGATGDLLHELESPEPQVGGSFGISLAGLSDFNGDGRGDVVVGAKGEDSDSLAGAGRAHVFDGVTGNFIRTLLPPVPLRQEGARFGEDCAAIEDITGDGVDEILIGAFGDDVDSATDAGRSYLFDGATGAFLRDMISQTPEENGFFGSVSGLSDVSGDGLADLVVSAFGEDGNPVGTARNLGAAYVFDASTGAVLHALQSPLRQTDGFLRSVSGVNDLNDDGPGEVIAGAYSETSGSGPENAGRVYLFDGALGIVLKILDSRNEEEDGAFGYALTGFPDVNGDGLSEAAVGAYNENGRGTPNAGRVYLFLSPLVVIEPEVIHITPDTRFPLPEGESVFAFDFSVRMATEENPVLIGNLLSPAPGETVESATLVFSASPGWVHPKRWQAATIISPEVPNGVYALRVPQARTREGEFVRAETRHFLRVAKNLEETTGEVRFSTSNSLLISWEFPVSSKGGALSPLVGSRVFRSTSAQGPFDHVAFVPWPKQSFLDEDLAPGATYFYQVIILGSEYEEVSRTLSFEGITIPKINNLWPEILSSTSIRLHWTGSREDDIIGYRVERSLSPSGPYSVVGSLQNQGTEEQSFVDTSLEPDRLYCYRVIEIDASQTERIVERPVCGETLETGPESRLMPGNLLSLLFAIRGRVGTNTDLFAAALIWGR